MAKYSDKCKECQSYISISEHRLEQYNELMSRKNDIEESKHGIIERLEEKVKRKDDELKTLRHEVFEMEHGISEVSRQDVKEIGHYKEVIDLCCDGFLASHDIGTTTTTAC